MQVNPFYCFLIALFLFSQLCVAQHQSRGIAEIEKALAANNVSLAEKILLENIEHYYQQRKADSLVNYIFYVGKVAQKKSTTEDGFNEVKIFLSRINKLSPGAITIRQANIEAAEYYGSIGKNEMAYKANQDALKITANIPRKTESQAGLIENNLSTYAQRSGDLSLAQSHGRRALQHFLADPNPDYEGMYVAYNGMGTAMYYASKIDSAMYYFQQALFALAKTNSNPVNKYYRPAIIQNNLSGLYGVQGKTTDAINAMRSAISLIKSFIDTKEPHPKKVTAVTFHFEAIDNLAGIYKELGDLRQAKHLLEYSYRQKMQLLTANDPAIFISQILLGQLYYAMNNIDKAKQFLEAGQVMISKADGDYLFWQADACNTLALLNDKINNDKQAAYYYEKADSLYEQSLHGAYDNIYLEFLRNAALFYAGTGNGKIANAKADKGYQYVVKAQGSQTLTAFYQLLNIAEVNHLTGRYKESLMYSKKGLEVVNSCIRSSKTLLDSVKIELKKPKAILIKSKAEYELLPKKDVPVLLKLQQQLQEALLVLERRKSIVTDAEDISLVMADHNELLEFVKTITLDLYQLSGNPAYINQLMGLHESSMYNRIRSRLDKKEGIQFAHIPPAIQAKEKELKASIAASLSGNASNDDKINNYFKATDNWNEFQEKIKMQYPRYYKMRYESIFKSLGEIQNAVPAGTTLIRYFYIDKNLIALVVDNGKKHLFPLNAAVVEEQVIALSKHGMDADKSGAILLQLYQHLWQPLVPAIHNKKIVIIPDRILYNLNFDILTPKKINAFKELATNSLLASYTISYHYSLFLLGQKPESKKIKNNFVAFAPGFLDELKKDHRTASFDPAKVDENYMSLLPQPFMLTLANKIKNLLGGSTYLQNQSTERSFKANAGNHKIIHLATHAESSNSHPEYSRLIFAKDTAASEDNSLYVDELYNCNLLSALTVLTACESGKPGYEDGEGMISLAHAFNYAGSESILTGLWKIDEQASALIMEFFYENLLNGMPKDEALRQAKITYLQQAEGRMLAPQYWAGLVIMGDTSPVVLQKKTLYWPWVVAGIIALSAILFFLFNKRKTLVRP